MKKACCKRHKIFSFYLILLILMMDTCGIQPLIAQAFDCDGTFFLSVANTKRHPSDIFEVVLNGNLPIATDMDVNNIADNNLNCLGFSVKDKHIYGFTSNTYELFKINALGEITYLKKYDELEATGYEFFAGEMSTSGNILMIIGRDKDTQLDQSVYYLRVDDLDIPSSKLNIQSNGSVRIDDIAFDPYSEALYGFDAVSKRFINLGLGTSFSVFTHLYESVEISEVGAMFFDQKGRLYAFGSSIGQSESTFFHINKTSGQIIETFEGYPSGSSTDGCTCSYTMDVFKHIKPRSTVPCTEVIMTYQFINHSAIGRSGGHLIDTLPEGFMIEEILPHPFLGIVNSGVGTNILDIEHLSILINNHSISIRVSIDENYLGVYRGQATLKGMPLALGKNILSDDPTTNAIDDPSELQVLRPEEFQSADLSMQFCFGETTTLQPPFFGNEYLWSTGSTADSIIVSEAGLYWVEVHTDCIVFRDTIKLSGPDDLLYVDLGEDQIIEAGTMLDLNHTTNASTPLVFEWESINANLNCYDCEKPHTTPLKDALYALRIVDEFGCEAIDSLWVEVRPTPNIYVGNAFSPNSDGINDILFVQGKGNAVIRSFMVFDRWGNQVFVLKDRLINKPELGWDGTFKGKSLDSGIYFWQAILDFLDGKEKVFGGEVLLMKE